MLFKFYEILFGLRFSLSIKMVVVNNDCVVEYGLNGIYLDISDKFRIKIWEGKDVSLVEFLMFKYEF